MSANPRIGSYEYFAQLHEVESRHWWSRGMRDIADVMIQRHFGDRTGLDVLDAGCGTGITLSWLARYSTPGTVTGVDVSEHALDFCRKSGHDDVMNASVTDLPFDDETFDLIVCNDVIQHVPDDQRALDEFRRVLKPGGLLNIRTNCKLGIDENKAAEAEDYRMYTSEELHRKIEAVGLEMDQLTYVNALMSLVTLARRFVRERKQSTYGDRGLPIRLLPDRLSWVNETLNGILKVEAAWLRRRTHSLPFGSAFLLAAHKPAG